MLREVYLYGAAGREFGRRWQLDVATPIEAIRALCVLRPGFRTVLRAGWWRVIVGPPRIRNAIELPLYGMNAGAQAIHIVPATPPQGGGIGAVGKIVAGVVIAAVGAYFGQYWAVGIGLSLAFGGVSSLLTPRPDKDVPPATDLAREEDRPSFLFNGVTNNAQQGGPVPVVMGTHLVGSVLVAGSVNIEDLSDG